MKGLGRKTSDRDGTYKEAPMLAMLDLRLIYPEIMEVVKDRKQESEVN